MLCSTVEEQHHLMLRFSCCCRLLYDVAADPPKDRKWFLAAISPARMGRRKRSGYHSCGTNWYYRFYCRIIPAWL